MEKCTLWRSSTISACRTETNLTTFRRKPTAMVAAAEVVLAAINGGVLSVQGKPALFIGASMKRP